MPSTSIGDDADAIRDHKVPGTAPGLTGRDAQSLVIAATGPATLNLNKFTNQVFVTRGGRIGSGLGLVLESLWGFYASSELRSKDLEIAWLASHEYNDYACVTLNDEWDPSTKSGELLRIEAKSMNLGADESKGHFDELHDRIGEFDLLLVLLWRWEPIDPVRRRPQVLEAFLGSARDVAMLRDALHVGRRGSFVVAGQCPDDPGLPSCIHVGEPVNAGNVRERRTGPAALKGAGVSYAANFGGLVRMLKCSGEDARSIQRKIRRENDIAHAYISFIHRHLPEEEANSFSMDEWRSLAKKLGVALPVTSSKLALRNEVAAVPGYQEHLRKLS